MLLENKRQVSYSKMFSIVIKAANDLSIVNVRSLIMTDFEVSIIHAAKEHFGEDSVRFCFFHLCQNVFRQIVQSGL